jgi:NAD(P)-dependent dehydrogenase (short-subunit alcohol dehydrogenase family)
MNLTNQVCVVTGGAKGIGLATAQALLARGARVALLDLDTTVLNDTHALSIRCDVTRAADLQSRRGTNHRATSAHRRLGEQRRPRSPSLDSDYTEAEIDLMLDVNLKGTILGSQAALKAMIPQKHGHIINVISTASLRGIPSETVYCAAKWGVRGFTQGLAEEAAAHRIRVTALLPGGVDTAFWDDAAHARLPRSSSSSRSTSPTAS